MNTPSSPASQPVTCRVDPAFTAMLMQSGGSLLISTYEANRVIAVACVNGQISLPMSGFPRPMGLAQCGTTLAVGCRGQIVLFEKVPGKPDASLIKQPDCDAVFSPRITYHTGQIAVHDVALTPDGELWFVNSHFSCVCRMNPKLNFEPVWRPPFISELRPEDRCHLNGMAIVNDRPKYATCLGATDTPGGWRPDRQTGGCLMDIEANQIIASQLVMPHSPRWHEERLWVLNSGAGELLTIDLASGQSTVVAVLPAYLRGMEFVGSTALIGMSVIRESHMLGSLPIQKRFSELLCGVAAVDLRTGAIIGMLRFTGGCAEMFEVKFLPGVRCPLLMNQ